MHVKSHLGFGGLRGILSERFSRVGDERDPDRTDHVIHDVLMSGYAVMYFQDPSLLQFQQGLEDELHDNNVKTLFGVAAIPKETQMRAVMDEVDSEELLPLFHSFYSALQRGKYLEPYRVPGKYYCGVIDGSEYFSSENIHCPGCLARGMRHTHQIVQMAIVHPDRKEVIPLAPEEVKNTDGAEKQDCEVNAGKRLIKKVRETHPKLSLIIIGDSLYSKQPFIEDLRREGMHFVLVAKEEDHKVLMEYVDGARLLDGVSRIEAREGQRLHVYEWINEVPLNGNKDAPSVNYFAYSLYNKGKRTYHNAWVTDIAVGKENVAELVRIGRSRWKIENEVFNTVKNHGYHIEHNYGHGKNHLSFNFFILNMLAFFMHQIFEMTDHLYQQVRKKLGSKQNFWSVIRGVLKVLIFDTWEYLLQRILTPMRFL
jgi:hypothetical protein